MFNSIFQGSLTAGSVLITLCAALILGFFAALYHIETTQSTRSFACTLALLPPDSREGAIRVFFSLQISLG